MIFLCPELNEDGRSGLLGAFEDVATYTWWDALGTNIGAANFGESAAVNG